MARPCEVSALIVTGAETDICVLSTVLAAVEFGYRVIVIRDGICSSSDDTHDALLKLYHTRFSEQIEAADADEVLAAWPLD
jgi:nicotinamidase-related amidase